MIHLLGLVVFTSSSALFGLAEKKRRQGQVKRLPQGVTPGELSLAELQQQEAEGSQNALIASGVALAMAVAGHFFYAPLGVLSLIPLGYASFSMIELALYHVRRRQLSILQVDTLALSIGVLSGVFTLSALASLIYLSGVKLLHQTRHQTKHRLASIFETENRAVWVERDGVELELTMTEVELGDRVVLNAGETIPIDGVVIEGMATVDQQSLTGEAQPEEKLVGSQVFASTLIVGGRIVVKVEKTGHDTVANHIALTLDSTEDYLATLQTRSEQLANRSIIPTFALAGSAALISPATSLVVLTSNYSEVMRLTVPLTMLNYLQIASNEAILIKDGRSLEQLQQIDTVVFDKTGTLTHEQPLVGQIYPQPGITESQLLHWIATAEYRQSHPIARAILTEAKRQQLALNSVDNAHYQLGLGLTVQEGGNQIQVGSRRFLAHEGVALPESIVAIEEAAQRQGHSLLYCAHNGQFVGMLELQPSLRPEAAEVVRRLQARGVEVMILSGDHQLPVARLAKELGVDHYYAETLPEQKAEVIDELQRQGRHVCYIGDGINDSIALKRAAISISLSDASHIAQDAAQIVLIKQNLANIERCFELSAQYAKQCNYGVAIAGGASVMGMTGALLMGLTLPGSVLIYSLSAATGLGVAMIPKWKMR